MSIGSALQRLRASFSASSGTIVFGMVDGTVSIFGLIFGVAATTNDVKTVLIAGASGAVAAAVSMMAGAYLDIETTRDAATSARAAAASSATSLSTRLAKAGLTLSQSEALAAAVQSDPTAVSGLLQVMQGTPEAPLNPLEQALWMLFTDFLAAAVPILPFVFFPIFQARVVSGIVTLALLVGLGIGRARIAKRGMARTVAETVSIGLAAAVAGVAIGLVVNRWFSP